MIMWEEHSFLTVVQLCVLKLRFHSRPIWLQKPKWFPLYPMVLSLNLPIDLQVPVQNPDVSPQGTFPPLEDTTGLLHLKALVRGSAHCS